MEGYFEDARQDYFTCPNYVEDMPEDVLCVHAFRVLCHVRRTMPGTFFDVRKLCERFGIGYDGKVWRRVSSQLRKLGALADVEVKDAQGRVVAKRLRFRWPEPIRAKGTDGVLGCKDTPPIRAKGTDPSVQKERIDLRLKTPADAAAASRRSGGVRRGKADAFSRKSDRSEGGEVVELVEAAGSGGVQGLAPSPVARTSPPFPRCEPRPLSGREPLPELVAYLEANGARYLSRSERGLE